MAFFPLLLAPFVAAMMAARAAGLGRGRGGGRGQDRGGRGGQNDAGLWGRTWVRNGDHAKEILRNWIARTPGWLTVDDFAITKSNWILHHGIPTGLYLWANLCRNYHATIERYENHINPNIDFDANYPAGFLEEVGAPGVPAENPDGLDFSPGDDGFGDPSEGANHQGEFNDAEEAEDVNDLPRQGLPRRQNPAQVPQRSPAPSRRCPARPAAAAPQNPRLRDLIDQATQQLVDLNMEGITNDSPYVIGTLDFHCMAINTVDMHANAVQNGLGIIALLAPGVDLKSIKMRIHEDLQTYTVTAQGVQELSMAVNMMPSQECLGNLNGPCLWESVRQAIQTHLNTLQHNAARRVVFSSDGTLAAQCTTDKIIKPSKLSINIGQDIPTSLAMEARGDRYLLHKILIRSQTPKSYTTAYIAIGFALEDMGEQNELPDEEIPRFLPDSPRVTIRSPGGSGDTAAGGRGGDPSPRSARRRRTGEDGSAVGLSASSGDSGYGDATMPDQAPSSWFPFGR